MKKWITVQLLLLIIIFGAAEIILRYIGYEPGDMRPKWLNLKRVDSLYVIHDFYTNHLGLLVADSFYWSEQGIAINSDNFRGKNLNELDSAKPRIMFIGDSFTWGMSAEPFQDSSFCDLLSSNPDLQILNFGIPAADPAQYDAIAQHYIPNLHPQVVYVVFFMGNDLMHYERIVQPGKPFYYWTNAGALLADVDGQHFDSPEKVYEYITAKKYFLDKPENWHEQIISRSSLLSRLYSLKYRWAEKQDYEALIRNTNITKKNLRNIVQVCKQQHVPLKLLLIPERKEADVDLHTYRTKYADLMNDSTLKDFWEIPKVSKAHFREDPDGHLNNEGHRVFYRFIQNQLDSILKN